MSRISSGNGRSLVSLGERRERERGEGGGNRSVRY